MAMLMVLVGTIIIDQNIYLYEKHPESGCLHASPLRPYKQVIYIAAYNEALTSRPVERVAVSTVRVK